MEQKQPIRLGIDALQVVVKSIADVARTVADLTNGFQFNEEVPNLIKLGQDVRDLLSAGPQVVPQFTELTAQERSDLTAYVQTVVSIPESDVAETVLVKILEVAIAFSGLLSVMPKKA